MRDGAGVFFDGMTSARHNVSLELADHLLRIRDSDGMVLEEWPYEEIEQKPAPRDVLRLGLTGQAITARLEIREPELGAAVEARALTIDRTGRLDRRQHLRVAAWSLLATVSLIVVAILIVPNLAGRLAPYVPPTAERYLGQTLDAQVRVTLDKRHLGDRLTCGHEAGEQAGNGALRRLVARLARAAALPTPITVSIVRSNVPNAFAIPGGHIYVFEGLLDEARDPDELAGVIAHEMGHVAHHDGMRSILQGAGLSVLFGVLLGDFVGGGAVAIAAKTLIEPSYSRKVEAAADDYGARLIAKAGGNPSALAAILMRIQDKPPEGMRIWVDHPQAEDRARAIARLGLPTGGAALLDADEWSALKHICAGL